MKKTALALFFFCCAIRAFADTPAPEVSPTDDTIASIESIVKAQKNDPTTLNMLVDDLMKSDGEVRVRERAAWALGELRATSAIPGLMDAAADKGLLVRSAALNSLVQLHAMPALSVFMNLAVNDPILSIRQRSTLALGLLRSEKGIQTLVTLSSDPREEIRGAAALSLGAVHSKKNDATQILGDMKKDASPYVQERARRALEGIRGTPAQLKAQLGSTDPDIRLFAAVHYAQRGKSTDVKFLTASANSDADEDVRDELTAAIKSIQARTKKTAHSPKGKPRTKKSTRRKASPPPP